MKKDKELKDVPRVVVGPYEVKRKTFYKKIYIVVSDASKNWELRLLLGTSMATLIESLCNEGYMEALEIQITSLYTACMVTDVELHRGVIERVKEMMKMDGFKDEDDEKSLSEMRTMQEMAEVMNRLESVN